MDLGSLTAQQYPDPPGRLATWARAFVRGDQTDTLALLKDLCAGVSRWISYQSREDEGTQSPIQTLDRGLGSCRDLAVLFVEAARSLGVRRKAGLRLPVQPRSDASRIDGRRINARLGRSLRLGRRVDQLRPDEPQRRRREPYSCRCRARHTASGARLRNLCGKQRRARGHDGAGSRDLKRRARAASGTGTVVARRARSGSLLGLTEWRARFSGARASRDLADDRTHAALTPLLGRGVLGRGLQGEGSGCTLPLGAR